MTASSSSLPQAQPTNTGSRDGAPALSIIIVNWNSKDYLRGCLQSLARHPPGFAVEVIVVDGGSYDGCGEMLAREFPEVVFIQSPENIGFARSNNLGARQAKGESLLLLNPDTEFIDDSLAVLYRDFCSLSRAGAVGCRLLNSDRTLQVSCVQSFPTVLNQLLDAEILRRLFPHSSLWGIAPLFATETTPVQAAAISGACILLNRERFRQVGGFSETYFMYGEDLDLCFKLTRAGYLSYYVPAANVVHHGGGSTGKTVSAFTTVQMRVSVHRFLSLRRGAVSATLYRVTSFFAALARLVLIGPFRLFGDRVVRHGSDSWRKWTSVLRWSIGLRPTPSVNSMAPAKAATAKAD